jgi:hypothetical protein
MDPLILLLMAVLLVIAIAVIGWMYMQKRRTERLAGRFGPEYGHAAEELGDRRSAERELEAREKRVEALNIQALSVEQRDQFATEWRSVQARFVDDPPGAIQEADRLVQQVMEARGYPVGDFEQRAADISVDHSAVVEHYRAGHDVAERQTRGDGIGTEDLRQAMVHYRALFEDLLEAQANQQGETRP